MTLPLVAAAANAWSGFPTTIGFAVDVAVWLRM